MPPSRLARMRSASPLCGSQRRLVPVMGRITDQAREARQKALANQARGSGGISKAEPLPGVARKMVRPANSFVKGETTRCCGFLLGQSQYIDIVAHCQP